jgi:IS5 family transposase
VIDMTVQHENTVQPCLLQAPHKLNAVKVSIIIPVYNVENYLSECLDSAIGQDYENKEIIIINDGSTDGSRKIIDEYQGKHPHIIVKHTKNQGQSAARNAGLLLASGDYVIFLDSDDWIESNTISSCLNKINEYKADIIFFAATAFADGLPAGATKVFNYARPKELTHSPMPSWQLFEKMFKSNHYIVSPCLFLYSKKKLGSVEFMPGILHEDNLFTTRILIEHQDTVAACIPDKFFHRRVRPESIMTKVKNERHINGYFAVAEALLKMDKGKLNCSTKKSLSHFIQGLILSAISTAHKAFDNKTPFFVRKKAINLLAKIETRHLKAKAVLCCIAPEAMILKGVIRRAFKAS